MKKASGKTRREFTAVVFQDNGCWVGFVEEVPGVNAQAKTRTELMSNLRQALRDILEIRHQETLAEVPPDHEEAVLVA